MATPTYKNILELNKNALTSPWKGQLIIQGCFLCDVTLCSTYGTVIPVQLPRELDFKYVMKVSSLKESLPEAAFRRQNYLEQKVCCQDLCFDLYEVELSNKQGENIDKLIEYIKNQQLAIIKCLEDREFFILLTSSALTPEPDFGDEQMGLHGLHLFHSPQSTGAKDLKVEDDISLKVIPIIPALSCALLEAKKSLPEKGIPPNVLVKHSFQDLYKVDKSLSLMAPQDGMRDTAFIRKLSYSFDLAPPDEKCPSESLIQLKSYFSDPTGYTLDLSTTLDLLAEHPQCPRISDGICDAGFSLVMASDPEFLDSEMEVRKETETTKKSEKMLRVKRAVAPLTPPSNLRVQPKRKASTSAVTLPNKRVSLGRPLSKRTAPRADSGSCIPTLKLVKGQFPQKIKRGAEVLTAQFVQKTRLDRKKREVSVSKDAPVATNAKRAKKQEKSPGRVVSRPKPPVKKCPPKQKVNVTRGRRNSKTRKQLHPAEKDITLHLQSEISSNGQKDGINLSTAQQESIAMIPKGFPENSIINCDSQALNMLADLALSSAASSIPPCELRNLPSVSELPQNNVLLSKENSLHSTSDHEYHRGVKSQKGVLLTKPSSDEKLNSESDLPVSQEENLVPFAQFLTIAQSVPSEEGQESSDASQNSVAVEHSYALLLAEQSKKHLHQRKLPSPAFAKNGAKGPEAGTPIGKVMPFRHLQNTSPLQKLSEDSLTKRKSLFVSSSLKDFFCSHTVLSCDGSFKITFKCEGEYAFSLDSKYTSNPLEKTVVRALHGPWNTDWPENMEDVKLLLHMWVALFYSKQNKVMGSPRKVVEHRNPAKYVCINRSIESFDQSEIEEFPSVERYSEDSLLENKETCEGHATNTTFPGPNCMLPFVNPPTTRDLELCVQNEQKEIFTGESHPDTSGSQNFIHSCNNEVTGGKDKQELSDIPETSNVGLSDVTCAQSNGSCIPSEDKTFPNTTAYDGAGSEAMMCHKSVLSTLENKVDTFHPSLLIKTGAVQDAIQDSSPINNKCPPSAERTDDNVEYMMINLEPVTLALEKAACVPIHTEVNTADKPTDFSTDLVKQVSPALSIQYPVSKLEEAQTQCPRDIPSLAISEYRESKCLSASSLEMETASESLCPLQKEIPPPTSADGLITEALPLVKSSSYSLASNKTKCPQDASLQTQNGFSMSINEVLEPSQVKVVSSSTSATLGNKPSLNCIPAICNISDGPSEVRINDKSSLNQEKTLQILNSVFPKQADLSMNREEVSMELSGEYSDTNPTLTVLPPTNPREEMAAGEIEQLQKTPVSNLGLQSRTEEEVEPEVQVNLIKNKTINSASYISVYAVDPREPLKETQSSDLKPGTLILSKENCAPKVAEEINIPSDFPFGTLIEEVSPASSPDPIVQTEETQPTPCLKLHGTQSEKSSEFSQVKSGDLTIAGKENSFVGPKTSMGQNKLTQVQVQLSAEMPQVLTSAGREGRVTVPSEIAEFSVPSEQDESLSFSEKVQCQDTELNKPTSPPKYGGNFKPLGKLLKSGNSLQAICMENRNLGIKPFALESVVPLCSTRKIVENKSLADTLVSIPSVSEIVNMSLKHTSSKNSKKNSSDFKTVADINMQPGSVNSASIDKTEEFVSSCDSAQCTYYTKPVSVEPGFQTQEIPVVRMASLLQNIGTELREERMDLSAVGLHSHSTSTKGEQKTICVLQDTSKCEEKKPLNDGVFSQNVRFYQNTADISKGINEEPSVSFVAESLDSVCDIYKEHTASENPNMGHKPKADSKALSRSTEISVNASTCYEPLSGDTDLDSLDCRNYKLDVENLCTLGGSHASHKDAVKGSSDSFTGLHNSDTWVNSSKISELETHVPPRSWDTESCPISTNDKCMPRYIQIPGSSGSSRTYANFTITKESKDTTRTLHSLKRHRNFTANCNSLSSWTSTWHVTDDLTQNTLDLEYLRFDHKLKEILKKGDCQPSSLSTNIFPKESLIRISVETCPSTQTSDASLLHLPPKSRSPILVTVVHSDTRPQSHRRRDHSPSNLDHSSFWKEKHSQSRNPERNQIIPVHLNKLKYNSTLKEARSDISLILNEYAEFNKVMMNSNQTVSQDKELNVASVEACPQETCQPRQSVSYKDVITDLCATLHIKLKGVMREACKSPFRFYLVETEDKSFFLRTKSILKKRGHTEAELLDFCQAFQRETETLLVIIKNEDIISHLHQIPSLLKLKHFPSVIFAGVDTPEDILNDTYQELFRSGGFVVSDGDILENLTLVQLKEIVKILEKLNENGRWKWLLHYRENKKLKEDVKVDSIAHKKNLILKSYQSVNIIELLHYHNCDSPSPTKAEILKCLLNLQIQHISARFAVFLTDKPTASPEVFENSGILVTDVNYFTENIQNIAAPFRSSYW
ncbi:protein TASOR 2 isoform X2 [Chionomys nivalis]|uniref:protein TASOR 2 isoform X1 n=1 Tax=Chionomys nivalis TaxID=269649 RepID=UPI0025944555|nr:protein TASOR 2 isoform X1 [Chionomys nivalis]XP_057642883.1 protein TASOR 2 isoform X2 [Chionomys nivalis]